MRKSQQRHVARRQLNEARRYARWPRERLYKAFVGLLQREGWTLDRIDAAADERSADHKVLSERLAWFMGESKKKGLI